MLRPYRRSDLERMVELDKLCFGPEFRFDERVMRRFAEGHRAYTYVAEGAPGEILGFVIVELAGRSKERHGYCVTLDVAPTQRGRGIGEALLRAGERWVGENGGSHVKLHVWVQNEAAIRFYERLGYSLQGSVPEFYGGVGMDALVYSRQLAPGDLASPETIRGG